LRKSGSSEEIIPYPQIKKFLKYEQNLMASMAKSKRKTPFQHKWLLLYGLEICAPDAKTSSVVSLRYRFCEFGREGANGDGDGEEEEKKEDNEYQILLTALANG